MKVQLTLLLLVAITAQTLAYGVRSNRRPNRRPDRRPVTPIRDPIPVRSTRDPWPAEAQTVGPLSGERQTRRTTRDPWPAEPRPGRTNRFPRPGTGRTTRWAPAVPTTTATPTGRNFCQTLIANGDCTEFYTCFFATQQVCSPDDSDPLVALVNYCLESEEAQDRELFGDYDGDEYIVEYRKCTQQRILQVVDSNSCGEISSEAEEILITEDFIWDCLYQNHTLCDIIENRRNSEALGWIFSGTDKISFDIYQHLLRRVNERCGNQLGEAFAEEFGGNFLSNMQSKLRRNAMMMMMGGNGGD